MSDRGKGKAAASRRTPRRCAFLTMDAMDGFVCDDELALEPLAERGWSAELVPWRREGVAWQEFDLVLIRTTWDYPEDPEAFLRRLEEIDSLTRLENPLRLVRWNLQKTYLRDLSARGIDIVPTRFERDSSPVRLWSLFEEFSANELIIKPVVGANAVDTFRLDRDVTFGALLRVERALRGREFMAQPFMASVVKEGEFAVFFMGGKYSHCILKTPAPGDFRVQEEYGGVLRRVSPGVKLRMAAERAVEAVDPAPFYARVDLIRSTANEFLIMELELIEPSLYLRMDPDAPGRFARAVHERFG